MSDDRDPGQDDQTGSPPPERPRQPYAPPGQAQQPYAPPSAHVQQPYLAPAQGQHPYVAPPGQAQSLGARPPSGELPALGAPPPVQPGAPGQQPGSPQAYLGGPPYAGYGYPPQPPLVRPTSGLAVTGFICSLLWGFGVLSLLAVVLCGIAMRDTGRGTMGGHGLAVAGLVLGLLGSISLLFFVLPVLVALFGLAGAGA